MGSLRIGTDDLMYTFGYGDTTVAMSAESKYEDLERPPAPCRWIPVLRLRRRPRFAALIPPQTP